MTERDTRIETYIPLYRKYRPQTFADLVGQEAISQTLGNAIRLNKVAHAYLFCGPRGTGKTSSARIFAKSLNCEQGPTETPCLQCASCTGVAQGTALDVIEFDAASNNGVSDARELIENCQYSAMAGRFKIYIIDEVHMLTSQAFNALLKTLEEPPPNVIFIFATTEAHKVLPTIISRCQRFDFNRISAGDIQARLAGIAQAEAISIDEEALDMIARHARGGLRDAVGLLDQVAVLGRARPDCIITRKDVAMFIGALEEDRLLRLSEAVAKRQAPELLNEITALLTQGIEPIQLLRDLTLHFRNLLLVGAAGADASSEILSLPADYHRQLLAQTALFPDPEELPQIIGRLSGVERNVRQSSQPQLWLEVGLLELTYRHEIYRIQTLSERLDRLEAQLAGLPASQPASQTPAPSTRPASRASDISPRAQAAPPPVAHASAASPDSPLKPRPVQSEAPQTQAPAPMPERMPARSFSPLAERPSPIGERPSGAASGLSGESLESVYARICAAVPSLIFRSLLQQQTFPLSLNDGILLIGCPSDAHLTTIKKPDKFTHLQKSAEKVLAAPVRVEVILEKKGAARPAEKQLAPPVEPPGFSVPAPAPVVNPKAAGKSEAPTLAALAPAAPKADPPRETPVSPEKSGPASSMLEALAGMAENGAEEGAGSPFGDMPPMEFGSAPDEDDMPSFPDEDEEDDAPPPLRENTFRKSDEASATRPPITETLPTSSNLSNTEDPAWTEARQHAEEVLQGRLLE